MTKIEANLLLNQAMIINGLALIVPAEIRDIYFEKAKEILEMVEKEADDLGQST